MPGRGLAISVLGLQGCGALAFPTSCEFVRGIPPVRFCEQGTAQKAMVPQVTEAASCHALLLNDLTRVIRRSIR